MMAKAAADHELHFGGRVLWAQGDIGVGGGPDAEELVDEALADGFDALEVEEDFAEAVEVAGEPLGFGAGDEVGAVLEQA